MTNTMYTPFKEIDFGFSDAEGYVSSNKDMFNNIFIGDELEALMSPDKYYLIGEKGTGKTAYAVFFENNDYKNTTSVRMNLEDTDILSFINMKKAGHLQLSEYKDIWEVVLLINIIRCVRKDDIDAIFSFKQKKYDAMLAVLENYGLLAFRPEVVTTLSVIQKNSDRIASELKASILAVSGTTKGASSFETAEGSETKVIQNSIFLLKNLLIDVVKGLRLKKNRFLFIDKIDVYNSSSINFDEYKLWVKYLAEAVYYLNTRVFRAIKDRKGFIKIVLLLRPDVFDKLNLYNQGNRIRDNSVILDWQTSYRDYRHSKLFKLADNLLRYANNAVDALDPKDDGFYWDLYFGWKSSSTDPNTRTQDDSFISFLRFSLCRPRDIVEFLKAIKQQAILVNSQQTDTTFECFHSYKCQKSISDYFLQEARDWCLYKYPNGEFETIKHFFGFMNTGKAVKYSEYLTYYNEYIRSCENRSKMIVFEEMETPEDFLQLLYELNMICYIETAESGETYQIYCYRMRSISDLSPKIPPNKEYRVHRALLKSLNIEDENRV